MINGSELIAHALRISDASAKPSEVERSRAISAAYYGLFHTLGRAAVLAIAGSDAAIERRLARIYDHFAFKRICQDLQKRTENRSEAGKVLLAEVPDPRLVFVGTQFSRLLQAREIADYDRNADVTPSYTIERVQLAAEAARTFAEVENLPETRLFLIALLFADRWPRRG